VTSNSCPASAALHVLLQYDGVGSPTVTQQTALELAIDDVTPKMFTCGILGVNTTAGSRSGVITALVSTAHRAGEYPPEVGVISASYNLPRAVVLGTVRVRDPQGEHRCEL
jgi:hypothetical protein